MYNVVTELSRKQPTDGQYSILENNVRTDLRFAGAGSKCDSDTVHPINNITVYPT